MEATLNLDSNEGSLKDFLMENISQKVDNIACIITCLDKMSEWIDESDIGLIEHVIRNDPTSPEESIIINLWSVLVESLYLHADLYCNAVEVDGEYVIILKSRFDDSQMS